MDEDIKTQLFHKLKNANINEQKLKEGINNKKINNYLKIIIENTEEKDLNTNLWFELAINMPIDYNFKNIIKLINLIKNKIIKNKKEIIRSIELLNNNIEPKFRFKTKNDLLEFLKNTTENKKTVLSKIINECEYNLEVEEIIKIINEKITNVDKKIRNILNEGELAKLHTPYTNYQKNNKILEDHLKRTGGKYITRFPPEPNGFLHIGHAKSLFLNFGYAELHNGECIVRFDDTNPKNEKKEYYDSIIESIKWMGYKINKITAASDHFDTLIEFGYKLIETGYAYVCHLTGEEIKEYRDLFKYSPYRNRPKLENKELFNKMINGELKEGEATLRLKQEYNKDNPLTQDLVAFRIINKEHPRNTKNIYPSYDFTHCLNDSLEDITHSFCSREFVSRKETYYWLINKLNLYKPVQWEFARLNISQTVLSKRKLTKLVEAKVVEGWDDPRLYSLMGLRRRGVTPNAIKNFISQVGYTFNNETIIDVKKFNYAIREDLIKTSRRIYGVIDPLLIEIKNFNFNNKITLKDFGTIGIERQVPVSNKLFINKSDFIGCINCKIDESCNTCFIPEGFQRLTIKNPVFLLKLFPIKVIEILNDRIIVEQIDNINLEPYKSKKYIQWVDYNNNVPVKYYNYSNLFNSFNPEEVDFMKDINTNSLEIKEGFADIRLKNSKKEERYQFDRIGYYCLDISNKEDSKKPIRLNLTIKLKSSI